MTDSIVENETKHVYVPVGTIELFASEPARVQANALDIMGKIASNPDGLRCHVNGYGADDGTGRGGFEGMKRLYGQVGKRGATRWVWYVVIEALVKAGAIETAEGHVQGESARRYRLTEEWAARPLVRYPEGSPQKPWTRRTEHTQIPAWGVACGAVAGFDLPGAVTHRLRTLGFSEAQARDLGTSLDFNAIRTAVEQSVIGDGPVTEELIAKASAAAAELTAELRPLFQWLIEPAECDEDGAERPRFRMTRDKFAGRLHSPVTNLSKDLRGFLTFGALASDDGGLVKIDGVNAQVVFLADVVRREIHTCPEAMRIEQEIAAGTYPDPNARGLADFARTCGEGLFYETTHVAVYGHEPSRTKMVEYREKRKTKHPVTGWFTIKLMSERDAWKKRIMGGYLFSRFVVQDSSDEGIAINKLWPSVGAFMRAHKSAYLDGDGVFHCEDTSRLPQRMQRAEAAIWIDALMPALGEERIPVFTIHDAVLVPAAQAARTLEIIEALYAARGLAARFDSEPVTRSL